MRRKEKYVYIFFLRVSKTRLPPLSSSFKMKWNKTKKNNKAESRRFFFFFSFQNWSTVFTRWWSASFCTITRADELYTTHDIRIIIQNQRLLYRKCHWMLNNSTGRNDVMKKKLRLLLLFLLLLSSVSYPIWFWRLNYWPLSLVPGSREETV